MRKKPSILVIDDDRDVRDVICSNLLSSGFTVDQAENGRKGIALLKQQPLPEVVITDILMPEQEGLETIMEIRRNYPAIKLIAISGSGENGPRSFLNMANRLGAHAILPKPVDLERLERTVNELTA